MTWRKGQRFPSLWSLSQSNEWEGEQNVLEQMEGSSKGFSGKNLPCVPMAK